MDQDLSNLRYSTLNNAADLDPLMDAIGERRVVLLGEASHGTSEYYTWRTAITKRLIKEKGFNFIAVEGDWPDCYQVNKYVNGQLKAGSAPEALATFNRWPTWMWGNWEVAALVEWMHTHNSNLDTRNKVGFYGLDVYSLWDSLQEILHYLERKDGHAVAAAHRAFRCFEPYSEDPQEYARAVAFVSKDCEDEVAHMLIALRSKAHTMESGSIADFSAEQNALIAVNAERYYRTMIQGGGNSWNVRDKHMMETLVRLMNFYGPTAKAIVWEHNTHIGDARATDMARNGMVNVGQLAREHWGNGLVYTVGFGSYEGYVIAGKEWGAPMQVMQVPPARENSLEYKLHQLSAANKLIFSNDIRTAGLLKDRIGHRAIGVVYHPASERWGNYVPSLIPERYDAFMYIDITHGLHPLPTEPSRTIPPDLYPWIF
jgi:erythromycin esterase